LQSPNGRTYQGEFSQGKRHGLGRLDYANGEFYVGNFLNDKPHGRGLLQSTSYVYDGFWAHGLRDGPEGTMVYPNGSVYRGAWKNGLPHGVGTLDSTEGGAVHYGGHWSEGHFNGRGKLLYATGDSIDGHFKDDLPHGRGLHSAVNNVLFEGKWHEGTRTGNGTLGVGPSRWSACAHEGIMFLKSGSLMTSCLLSIELPTFHLSYL